MVSRTCKTFHGEALDRRFDEMNDVKFNAANLSRCTHRRILNAHVALNGVSGTHRRAGTPPSNRGFYPSHSETSETWTGDGRIKHGRANT